MQWVAKQNNQQRKESSYQSVKDKIHAVVHQNFSTRTHTVKVAVQSLRAYGTANEFEKEVLLVRGWNN